MESYKRSVIKSLSWRILATLVTISIVFILTGKSILSLQIGLVEIISKILIYYFHERIWNTIKWGKTKEG